MLGLYTTLPHEQDRVGVVLDPYGARYWDRTSDLMNVNHVLSQLS
jgi:hypothetical protein